MVTDRANICTGCSARLQADAALCTRKLYNFVLLRLGIDRAVANRTLGLCALGLIKDHLIAAVRAFPGCQLVSADIDRITAGAVDLLAGKEARFRLGEFTAVWAFDDKSGHNSYSFLFAFTRIWISLIASS